MNDKKIIDPTCDINPDKLPLICLSDDMRHFLPYAIKSHTQGDYGHVMAMHKDGFFASQGLLGYKEILLTKYLRDGMRL